MIEIVSLVSEADREAAAEVIKETVYPDLGEDGPEIIEEVKVSDIVLGAFKEDRLVAAANGTIEPKWLAIYGVGVLKPYRGHHIGARLMEALEHEGARKGAKTAYLVPLLNSPPFYTRLGYVTHPESEGMIKAL